MELSRSERFRQAELEVVRSAAALHVLQKLLGTAALARSTFVVFGR
jgi:hypothetical protein